MKITMTAVIERQRARVYTQKAKKLLNIFIFKKPDTFQKARQFPLRFYIQKRNGICLAFCKVSGFLYIKKFLHFFAFCLYIRPRCLSMMAVIVIFIHIQKPIFLRNVFIYTNSKKNQSCLRTEYRELS